MSWHLVRKTLYYYLLVGGVPPITSVVLFFLNWLWQACRISLFLNGRTMKWYTRQSTKQMTLPGKRNERENKESLGPLELGWHFSSTERVQFYLIYKKGIQKRGTTERVATKTFKKSLDVSYLSYADFTQEELWTHTPQQYNQRQTIKSKNWWIGATQCNDGIE